jgi:hypothetical protein
METRRHGGTVRNARILRWLSLGDLILFPLFTLAFIWRLQFRAWWTWIVFPLWLFGSFVAQRDTLDTLGWGLNDFWAAIRSALKVFSILVLGMILLGLLLHGPRPVPHALLSPLRFVEYCAFCLLQQIGLNSLIQNRTLSLIDSEWVASAVSGAIFAAMHWPNPVLVPATLLLGTVMAWLFARHRNILPLAVGQAVLGTLAGWTFSATWIHHLRVGPGYYTWRR